MQESVQQYQAPQPLAWVKLRIIPRSVVDVGEKDYVNARPKQIVYWIK